MLIFEMIANGPPILNSWVTVKPDMKKDQIFPHLKIEYLISLIWYFGCISFYFWEEKAHMGQ